MANLTRTITDYVSIARPSHWSKNVFVLPGVFLAAILTARSVEEYWLPLLLGLSSACLIASANYTINERLDAEFDRFHPVKRLRPGVAGRLEPRAVLVQYVALASAGLLLAARVRLEFVVVSAAFLLMGTLYNVKPFRLKDRLFLDVLSESINNPIRMLLGWYIVTASPVPPSSLLIAYWMAGAYLMDIKRFGERRFISDAATAARYRRTFRFYTEETLLLAAFLYGLLAAFFMGVFLIKYKVELIVLLPFIAALFTWYLWIGFRADSPVQHPERLFLEPAFFAYLAFTALLAVSLFSSDIPWLEVLAENSFIHP